MFLNKNALFTFFAISLLGWSQIFTMEQENKNNNNSEEKKIIYDENLEELLYDSICLELNNKFQKQIPIDIEKIKQFKDVKIIKLKNNFIKAIIIRLIKDTNELNKQGEVLEVLKILLNLDFFHINEIISHHYTILQMSILWGQTELTKILLENKNINVNCYQDQLVDTPLFYAIKKAEHSRGNNESVKALINHPSINIFLKIKKYYIVKIIKLNCLEFAKEYYDQLLLNLDEAEQPKKERINLQIQNSSYQLILNKLKEWRASLFNAIKQDKKDSFDKFNFCLIKLGAYVKDEQDNNILHCAINAKNKDYIYEILSIAPNLLYKKNKVGITPFDLALQNMSNDKENIMKIILDFAYKFKAAKKQETKVINNNNTENGKEEQK